MNSSPFDTVLVANRGEIAVRVIRTLRRLGIRSVAVHSDADTGAPHVRAADQAVRLGPADAARSYLDIDAVLAAARATGADAIHPGYGFLSENPAFARACADAGITLVGPPPGAMEAMADKIAARDLVAAHGVPVLPGTTGTLTDAELLAAAPAVGFPLIVKPAAGGGGKGMQIVDDAAALPAALTSARRVAAAAFGDDTLLLERYVPGPRHIEVQILADVHGDVVHLGERECSLQRRHQKVIEEAPSALLAETGPLAARAAAIRAAMGAAACEVARSCGYVGAGTVEMLVPGTPTGTTSGDDGGSGEPAVSGPPDFWFLEMNTRLQVEHPVTEAVTGLDLVELQLRVAAGEKLPFAQDDVTLTGHAVEARVYAEVPARDFLPDTGEVLAWREPAGPGVRVDSGITTADRVTGDYDPLLAKIVAHGADRSQALDRLERALADTVVLGVETNLTWLRDLTGHPDVRAGRLDTGLIERAGDPVSPAPDDADLAVAARALLRHARRGSGSRGGPTGSAVEGEVRRGECWGLDGFRIGGPSEPVRHEIAGRVVVVASDGVMVTDAGQAAVDAAAVDTAASAGGDRAGGGGEDARDGEGGDDRAGGGDAAREGADIGTAATAPRREAVHLPATAVVQETGRAERTVWVHRAGRVLALSAPTRARASAARRAAAARGGDAAGPQVLAAMPGTVAWVAADGEVAAGEQLVIVEAMKMEHPLVAPHDGVARVRVAVGDQVRRDQVLATVTTSGVRHEGDVPEAARPGGVRDGDTNHHGVHHGPDEDAGHDEDANDGAPHRDGAGTGDSGGPPNG